MLKYFPAATASSARFDIPYGFSLASSFTIRFFVFANCAANTSNGITGV